MLANGFASCSPMRMGSVRTESRCLGVTLPSDCGMRPMDCRRALKLISALIDRELAARDHRKLEAHLADCPDCRLALDDFRRQDTALRGGFARCRSENGRADRQLGNRLAVELVTGERPHSLLVVDDDPHILATVAGMAAPEFEVLKAPSASAAQELLQSRAVDILLTDQR